MLVAMPGTRNSDVAGLLRTALPPPICSTRIPRHRGSQSSLDSPGQFVLALCRDEGVFAGHAPIPWRSDLTSLPEFWAASHSEQRTLPSCFSSCSPAACRRKDDAQAARPITETLNAPSFVRSAVEMLTVSPDALALPISHRCVHAGFANRSSVPRVRVRNPDRGRRLRPSSASPHVSRSLVLVSESRLSAPLPIARPARPSRAVQPPILSRLRRSITFYAGAAAPRRPPSRTATRRRSARNQRNTWRALPKVFEM
jgi:hypothetical protein